jgi:hypothetical protein
MLSAAKAPGKRRSAVPDSTAVTTLGTHTALSVSPGRSGPPARRGRCSLCLDAAARRPLGGLIGGGDRGSPWPTSHSGGWVPHDFGNHRRHRKAQPLDAGDEVPSEPPRHAFRQRRHDDLVEAPFPDSALHRLERIRTANEAVHRTAGCPPHERQSHIQRPVGCLSVGGVRDEQRELTASSRCARLDRVHQPGGGRRPARHDKNVPDLRRPHPIGPVDSTCPRRSHTAGTNARSPGTARDDDGHCIPGRRPSMSPGVAFAC